MALYGFIVIQAIGWVHFMYRAVDSLTIRMHGLKPS